jgi:hypothetical protein
MFSQKQVPNPWLGHNTRPSFIENGECLNTNIFKKLNT